MNALCLLGSVITDVNTKLFSCCSNAADTGPTLLQLRINPFSAKLWKLSYFNFHPCEVVSRYRDPQIRMKICLIWHQTFANLDLDILIPNKYDLIW